MSLGSSVGKGKKSNDETRRVDNFQEKVTISETLQTCLLLEVIQMPSKGLTNEAMKHSKLPPKKQRHTELPFPKSSFQPITLN